MINDKRRAPRRPMHYTAWIARKGEPLHGCVISDISDKGARLDVENPESLPDEFMLFLSNRGSPRRKCRVAWRTDDQIGVKFESPLPAAKARGAAQAMMAAKRAATKAEDEKEPA